MSAVLGAVVVKAFKYRDELVEEFSNLYWLKGAPPGDTASWDQLAADFLNLEKAIYPATVSFHSMYGYNSNDPNRFAVYHKDWTVPGPPPTGSYAPGTGPIRMAGDQAALVQWRTDRKNSRGKWIYLRKYIHGGLVSATDTDKLDPTYQAALQTYANTLGGPTFHGGLRPELDAHMNATITDSLVVQWATTRTLKRRGKRPPLAA